MVVRVKALKVVLGALKEEISAFTRNLSGLGTSEWRGRTLYEGFISGEKCVVTWTGVGKVYAAMTVQYMIDTYSPDLIFFIGIAGAVSEDLKIGDMVVAEDSVFYDLDITDYGFAPGELPRPQHGESVRFFPIAQSLVEKARGYKNEGSTAIIGRICTGDSFITQKLKIENRRTADFIHDLECCAVEMEGASAAQVCYENGIPFLLARIISDTPDGKHASNFKKFLSKSSEALFLFINYMILK